MNKQRIDFSALDPSRDELHWARAIDSVVRRALGEYRQRMSIEHQLLRWARPVLAVAAGLCLFTWTASLLAPHRPASVVSTSAATEQGVDLTIASWAANHQIPEPNDLLRLLRGN